jgi:polysaccharide biosynthesis protein PslJ
MADTQAPAAPARAAGRDRNGVDVVAGLTLYLVLLFALPSRLGVGPLGGAGSPASLFGLVLGLWWLLDRLHRPEADSSATRGSPVRRAVLVVVAAVLVSYVLAMTRAIDATERSTADLGLVALLSWVGVLLVTDDGVSDQDRLDRFTRRLVLAGGLVAALGLVQFLTGQAWVDRIHVPGLVADQTFGVLNSRDGFNRPASTMLHPIEFGSVLTMLLPLAVNTALTDRTRGALRRWAPVALMSLAVVISISRSAMICAVVGLVLVAWRWPASVRRGAAAAAGLLLVAVFVAIPGMMGTLVGLFTGISSDGSATSRVDSYSTAGFFIDRSPLFGRGLSTFLPAYRILDNQYLVLLIEIGVVGTAAVLWLMVTGIRSGLRARILVADPGVAQRTQALTAGVAAGAVGLAFYDGFGFPTATATLFLLVGLTGAQLRIARRAAAARR